MIAGNIGPDGKQKYAMVCISNGTAKTAIIENCTVNDANFAFNTEEMTETTTHFISVSTPSICTFTGIIQISTRSTADACHCDACCCL